MGISCMEVGPSGLACRDPSHRAQKPEGEGVINNRRARQQASGW